MPSERETRKLLIDPCLQSDGWRVVPYERWLTVAQGLITVGAWYLFINSLDRFWSPIQNLSAFWSQVQGGLSSAERVFALMDAESAITQTEERPVPRLRGDIVFDHLSFRYSLKEPILEDFSLHIRPGREPGSCRPHRRRKVVHCQIDRPLLRVPGRPAAD
jgi:ABC-type transport system involved in Fe-S cluster assembly fused permease/ATPase subunit